MVLTSAIKYTLVLFISLFINLSWSQEDKSQENENSNSTKTKNALNYGVKGSFGVAYNIINPSGDKYVGLAYKGKGGYALKFKLFVYEGFFVGGSAGFAVFENTNTTLTGNYDKTSLGSHYLFLGYEYRPIEKLALGLSTSIFGEARYKNEYRGGNEAFQVDKARLKALEASVDYFITPNLSVNLYYVYRNDKTNIRTSSNLQSRFDRAHFSIIGLGINFQFGNEAVISSFKSK